MRTLYFAFVYRIIPTHIPYLCMDIVYVYVLQLTFDSEINIAFRYILQENWFFYICINYYNKAPWVATI